MIGYLSGRAATPDLIVVGGVGYQVETPSPLPDGELVEVWVHTAVRENDISLFGFTSPAERSLFDALTKVTGIGPRVALSLLSLGAGTVAAAIRDKDAAALAKAPGIGVRKAQSLLLAVKVPDPLIALLVESPDAQGELVDALAGLGFDRGAARVALADLTAAGITDEDTLMRRAMSALRAA